MKLNDNHQKLVNLIKSHAPDLESQKLVFSRYQEMHREFTNDHELELRLAGMLYDGLAYGNWPWLLTAKK